MLTGFLLSTATRRDTYFQRLATGSQKRQELSRADLGLVFAACSSIGMTGFEYLSRGGFGIIIATSMHGKDAVVPDTLAEDPLYREATTLSFLQLALHLHTAVRGTASDLLQHPFLSGCPQ